MWALSAFPVRWECPHERKKGTRNAVRTVPLDRPQPRRHRLGLLGDRLRRRIDRGSDQGPPVERDWEVVPPDVITFITIYDDCAGSCYSTLSQARAWSLMSLTEVHEYNVTQRTTVKVHPGRLP